MHYARSERDTDPHVAEVARRLYSALEAACKAEAALASDGLAQVTLQRLWKL
eukprot:gene22396-29507_t